MQPRPNRQSHTPARREVAGAVFSDTCYPPRLHMPRHAHEPASFSLVLEGRYAETTARKKFDCRPATLVFRPPAEPHAVAFDNSPVRIFRIDVGAQWLESAGERPPGLRAAAEFAGGRPVWIAHRLYREFCLSDQFSPLAIEGLSLELLAESARATLRTGAGQPPRWLERAREMLRERPTEAPALSEIAAQVGVHRAHLAHEFRRFYGTTAGEYLRRIRIEQAARVVAETELPLSEVAAATGFYDQSHFSNAFKRATGSTPAQYRAAFRPPQARPN
ncbi:MAG: AraC family transcriptional regulator [Acidobacteria bacterium]|nr:AraC family transcriptional regulator [Acidobacteriota bacterium]